MLGLTLTAVLPLAVVVIAICDLAAGLAYDRWQNETPLSWLPYSLALPLLPIWMYIATGEWRPLLWWAFPLGAALGLALHLSNEAPDVGRAASASFVDGRHGQHRSIADTPLTQD